MHRRFPVCPCRVVVPCGSKILQGCTWFIAYVFEPMATAVRACKKWLADIVEKEGQVARILILCAMSYPKTDVGGKEMCRTSRSPNAETIDPHRDRVRTIAQSTRPKRQPCMRLGATHMCPRVFWVSASWSWHRRQCT